MTQRDGELDPVRDSALHRRILDDFYHEQEHYALSMSYRHGLLRTVFVLARSLFFSRRSRDPETVCDGEVVAVAFFENELAAVKRASASVAIDRVLKFDLRSLSVVRAQLGWATMLAELLYFLKLTAEVKGLGYLSRSSIPTLGWLVYRAFQHMLAGRSGVTLLTTNMVHPTSAGVSWAAVEAGQRTIFYEHATTTPIIMKDRGYDRLFVNFHHTRAILVAQGFDEQRIEVMQAPFDRVVTVLPEDVRTAAFCINSYDSLPAVADVVEVLQGHDLTVIVRIHDADPRVNEVRAMSERLGFELDLARASKIQDFFKRVELVVTGNSNVIADALIAGRAVIYYWTGVADMFDYYGFVQYHQLPHATRRDDLQRLVTELLRSPRPC